LNKCGNFFQTLFFVEKQIDYLKMNYFYKRDFSPYEEFIQLRGNNKKANHITKIMLASFLDNFLENGEKKELLLKSKFEPFFNRFDKDGDLLISYTDFIQSIEPYCTNV
jgi:Ca2+-binding EF-hand superfamily protein